VGQVLKSAGTRPRDFFARFGGEEFVMVLPETNANSAKLLAERCRGLVFKEQILHEKSAVSRILTVSIGVGTIIPSQQDEVIRFIEHVDRQLYQAKRNGRNAIVNGH
jgi:diguanylate cyclase (GGDEF)-like protein